MIFIINIKNDIISLTKYKKLLKKEKININLSWLDFVNNQNVIKEKEKIDEFLKDEQYYPEYKNIYRFMQKSKYDIKVVILGMEPYPSFYEDELGNTHPIATGRSFEIANVNDWSQKFKQTSLRNILKAIYYSYTGHDDKLETIREKIQNGEFPILQPHEWFDSLENQGVLFLNASLTVKQGKVQTHTKIWENYMNLLINELNRNNDVVWMIWGKDAMNRIEQFNNNDNFKKIPAKNIYYSSHPRRGEFVKENPFGKIKNINWLG